MKLNLLKNFDLIYKYIEGIKLYRKSKYQNNKGNYVVYHYTKEKSDYIYSFEGIILVAFFMLLATLNTRNNFIFKYFLDSDKKVKFETVKVILTFYDELAITQKEISPDIFFTMKIDLSGSKNIWNELDNNYSKFSNEFHKKNSKMDIDMNLKSYRYNLIEVRFMLADKK